MSRQQVLFKRLNAGGSVLPPIIDPATLTNWAVLLDSRNLPVVADGTAIASWADSSGNGRNAGHATVPTDPLYRVNSSAKGQPLADFNAANTQMAGSLPVGGLDPTAGFSIYCYYLLDSVPSANAFDSQIVFGDDVIGGFRMFASSFQGAGDIRPAFTSSAASLTGGIQATTGRHILACICHPPSGGTGTAELFYDDALIASGLWNTQPQTTYLVSGNAGQNIWLRGRLGFAGIAQRDDSPHVRKGIQNFLLRTFG